MYCRSSVRLQLSQSRAAAACNAVHHRGHRRQQRAAISFSLPVAQCLRVQSGHLGQLGKLRCPWRPTHSSTTAIACRISTTTCSPSSARSRRDTLLTVSYVGNQGHHILALSPLNPGNPALCLSLPGCGPFGEDTTYTNAPARQSRERASDKTAEPLIGTGENYGEIPTESVANSNYNALETTLRYQHQRLAVSAQLHLRKIDRPGIQPRRAAQSHRSPAEPRHLRVGSEARLRGQLYAGAARRKRLPQSNRLTEDGASPAQPASPPAFPSRCIDNSDNSLLGTLGNGANNYLLDTPQYLPGPLKINTNGRNGRPAFNTSLFPEENPRSIGQRQTPHLLWTGDR